MHAIIFHRKKILTPNDSPIDTKILLRQNTY